jgi:hypothetical protein
VLILTRKKQATLWKCAVRHGLSAPYVGYRTANPIRYGPQWCNRICKETRCIYQRYRLT